MREVRAPLASLARMTSAMAPAAASATAAGVSNTVTLSASFTISSFCERPAGRETLLGENIVSRSGERTPAVTGGLQKVIGCRWPRAAGVVLVQRNARVVLPGFEDGGAQRPRFLDAVAA